MAVLYDILTLWPLALYAAFFWVIWRYAKW